MVGLLGVGFAVLAGGMVWWLGERERGYRDALTIARQERAAGRLALASARLEKIETEWPDRGEARLEHGLCEIARGRLDTAIHVLEKLASGTRLKARADYELAQAEIQAGRFTGTEDRLRRALKEAEEVEDRRPVRESLVRLLRSEGRTEEARVIFLEGWEEAGDRVAFLKRLYTLDTDPFPIEGVRAYLENAARRAPEDDRVWLGRANLALKLGEVEEAGRLIARCLERRPDDSACWRMRLEWAIVNGDVQAVGEAAKHLPADAGAAADVRWRLASGLGDVAEEERALGELVELVPGRAEVHRRLAELATGRREEGRALIHRERKSEIDAARVEYERLLSGRGTGESAGELSRLAGVLGREFEACQWGDLAGRRFESKATKLRSEGSGSLAALLPAIGLDGVERRGKAGGLVVPRFEERAESSGLRFVHENGAVAGRLIPPVTSSGGVGLLDYDGDGWLDVYAVQGGRFPPGTGTEAGGDRLFRNLGGGRFEDVTERAGLPGRSSGYGHGVSVGDIDNDGDADLFVTRWRRYELWRNEGDGTFVDATVEVELEGDRDWPTSSAFADLDGDGDLDLYVCHYLKWDERDERPCADADDPAIYRCNPRDFEALPDHLFRNDGGRFTEVTEEAGIVDREGRGLGVVATDLDGDGRIDLFVANDTTANYLLRNLGEMRFEEVALGAGVAANANGGFQAGMGVACGDLDGDGLPDLAVTNYYNESTSCFLNMGSGLFRDATAALGVAVPSRFLLGFGAVMLDANNDGRLDLLTVNGHVHDGRPQFPWKMPAQLLLGDDRGQMVDASGSAGEAIRVPRMGRGLAVGDLDQDGRVDALIISQNEAMAYLHNEGGGGRALTIALRGVRSNRDGVGAKVIVEAGGRRQTNWRLGGGSYQSAGDPRLHFGLGAWDRVDRVEVTWPSGVVDVVEELRAGGGYVVVEGEGCVGELPGFDAESARADVTKGAVESEVER